MNSEAVSLETLRAEIARLQQQVTDLQDENGRLRTQQQAGVDYQTLYDQLPASLIIYQLDGTMIAGNESAQVLHNTPMQVAVGNYNVLENPENQELGVPARFQLAREGHIATLPPVYYTGQHVEGRRVDDPFWVEVTFFPLRDAAGTVRFVAALETNVTDQIIAEQDRDRFQQQVLDAKESAIRELSTPLIPLAENVIAMPLVGSMNQMRAQQVMEVLLQGIGDYQAEQAILDITGVSTMEIDVAESLINTARAVNLLGAQLILTGISAAMAQTLVQLGADLSTIVTRSTLQSGIAYALRQS